MCELYRFYSDNPVVSYQAHTDWVTKAAFVDQLQSIVSGSVDNVLCLYEIDTQKKKWRIDMSKVKVGQNHEPVHTRGVRTWDWSRHYSMFATGGVERIVHLWSPFVNRPVGILEGGGSSIHQVLFNDNDNQLISLEGTHKRVRLWDIRMLRCLGEVQDQDSPDSAFICMMYDRESDQLVVGGCRPQILVKKGSALVEGKDEYIALAVSQAKNLIAAADEKNQIHLYRVGSGRHVFNFEACPPDKGRYVT